MIRYYAKYPLFDFNFHFKGMLNIYVYKLQRAKCSWSWVVNFVGKEPKPFSNEGETFTLVEMRKNVMFDYAEITHSEYTKHRLCITLWKSGRNALYGDMMFLPVEDFDEFLEQIGYNLSEKQKKYLNKACSNYAKKYSFPIYQTLNED